MIEVPDLAPVEDYTLLLVAIHADGRTVMLPLSLNWCADVTFGDLERRSRPPDWMPP